MEADRLAYASPTKNCATSIQHGPYAATFFPDGKFVGQDAYEGMIQRAELTVPMFEQGVKKRFCSTKFAASLPVARSSAKGHPPGIERRNTKVKFDYAFLQKDDLMKQIHPGDANKGLLRRSQGASTTIPSPKNAKSNTSFLIPPSSRRDPVSQEELQSYYSDHRDDYRVPEQVSVRHILIKTPLPAPMAKSIKKEWTRREKSGRHPEAGQGWRKFRGPRQEVLRGPGSAKDGRVARLHRQGPHCPRV